MDLPGGPGGTEYAPPMETRRQGPAAHHRGGGGQLPRDARPPPHPPRSPRVPCPLDTGGFGGHAVETVMEKADRRAFVSLFLFVLTNQEITNVERYTLSQIV